MRTQRGLGPPGGAPAPRRDPPSRTDLSRHFDEVPTKSKKIQKNRVPRCCRVISHNAAHNRLHGRHGRGGITRRASRRGSQPPPHLSCGCRLLQASPSYLVTISGYTYTWHYTMENDAVDVHGLPPSPRATHHRVRLL